MQDMININRFQGFFYKKCVKKLDEQKKGHQEKSGEAWQDPEIRNLKIIPPPQYQEDHQNMPIIPPNAGHGFAALF